MGESAAALRPGDWSPCRPSATARSLEAREERPGAVNRRLREVVVVGLVIATLASVVVAAVHADGRTSIRAETNDGGAWLVRRSDGVIGQMNRASGEVTGLVRVANPQAAFDVEQATDTVVVHDTDTNELQLIDPRTYQIVNTVSLPVGVHVRATDAGAVIWQPRPLRVWELTRDDLAAVVSLDDVSPSLEAEGSGLVTTTVDDATVVLDVDGGAPLQEVERWADKARALGGSLSSTGTRTRLAVPLSTPTRPRTKATP